MSCDAAAYHRYLRRLSDDDLQAEHLTRLNARDMRHVMAILRELDDRQHGHVRAPERLTPDRSPAETPAMNSAVLAFGKAVRRLRQERGLSIEDLAGAAGRQTTYISAIERGRLKAGPTISAIFDVARALEISPPDLIQECERDGLS
jgi:ribosome-binding protein aMBF1 (putative translation factor)